MYLSKDHLHGSLEQVDGTSLRKVVSNAVGLTEARSSIVSMEVVLSDGRQHTTLALSNMYHCSFLNAICSKNLAN